MKVKTIYKHLGETPLAALERYRKEAGISDNVSLTYAGRLDPAAEGVIPVLENASQEEKDQITNTDKTYLATFLFGVCTDTRDLLGVPTKHTDKRIKENLVEAAVKLLPGNHTLPYPSYSSRKVEGKQLWEWARRGTSPLSIPERSMSVYTATGLGMREVSIDDVVDRIELLTTSVQGDFRQKEILEAWKRLQLVYTSFLTAEVELKVASGTYVRALCDMLSRQLRIPTTLYSLVRTKVEL